MYEMLGCQGVVMSNVHAAALQQCLLTTYNLNVAIHTLKLHVIVSNTCYECYCKAVNNM